MLKQEAPKPSRAAIGWIIAAVVGVLTLGLAVAFALGVLGQTPTMSSEVTDAGLSESPGSGPESTQPKAGSPVEAPAAVTPEEPIPEADSGNSVIADGASHRGDSLWFVICLSTTSKSGADAALEQAIPSFGDMESYHHVFDTDDLDGMAPGLYIIAEPYRSRQTALDNLDFSGRAFEGAYVKQATVMTDQQFRIYEDEMQDY